MRKSKNRGRHATRPSSKAGVIAILGSETARFAVFCLFVASVFLMGGGSRGDVLSLVILRPLAVGVAAYALLVAQPGSLREVRGPLSMLSLLAILMIVQLIPMPQSWWSALPGRSIYAAIGENAEVGPIERPLSLAPSRTLNSLLSLTIPIATVLIIAVQGQRFLRQIFLVIAIACSFSVVWAIAQVSGPDQSVLYTYRLTNNGFPVGPFANRNHFALLLAIFLVLIGFFVRRLFLAGRMRPFLGVSLAMGAMVVLALILVAGSRAGLILAVVASPLSGWLVYQGYRKSNRQLSRKAKLIVAGGSLAGVLIMVVLAAYSSQMASLDRLSTTQALQDNRLQRLALILEMMRHHWLVGIGFGAFENVFKGYETVEVLTPFIFNQAHNDWLQVVIEGGLPAVGLVAAALAWTAREAVLAVGRGNGEFNATSFTGASIIFLVALASLVDYPLRTPIVMFMCATAFVFFSMRKGSALGR